MLITTANTQTLLDGIAGKATVNAGQATTFTSGNVYIGLFTKMPANDGTGGAEPVGNEYARLNIALATSGDNTATMKLSRTYLSHAKHETGSVVPTHSRRIGNTDQLAFHEALDPSDPDAVTGGEWGLIVGFGLFTVATGGTPFAWGELDTPVRINTHNILLFRKGHFEIYMDGEESQYTVALPTVDGATVTQISNTMIEVKLANGSTLSGDYPAVSFEKAVDNGGNNCSIAYSSTLSSSDQKDFIYIISNQTANITTLDFTGVTPGA